MGLYLCIFDDEGEEITGFQVGHYSDFGVFRDTIVSTIPNAIAKYPLLMQHSDCDGQWPAHDLPALKSELQQIGERFKRHPAVPIVGAFEHVAHCRDGATSLYQCFHTPDEENLFEALIDLCDKGIDLNKPVSFQ
jgi:hypothetical protein